MSRYSTIFALKDSDKELFKVLDDICFNISNKDETFEYKTSLFRNKSGVNKLVVTIFSDSKDIAYKRGLLVKQYFKNKTGEDIFFKIKESKR